MSDKKENNKKRKNSSHDSGNTVYCSIDEDHKTKEKKESKYEKEKKIKTQTSTKLNNYKQHEIVYLQRVDLIEPSEDAYTLWRQIPNKHKKRPDCLQRTPNVAVDNLVLWNDPTKKEINVALGWYEKESATVGGDKILGWCLPGGHVEYEGDITLEHAAERELGEEMKIHPDDLAEESRPLAYVADFLRDKRNKYTTLVYGHFSNTPPKASEEHSLIVSFPLSKLKEILNSREKTLLNPKLNESYGFVHGHSSIIAAILESKPFKSFLSDVQASKMFAK
jgi:ADP-ribose pyrophosphatase YjhB (NUDIX family)